LREALFRCRSLSLVRTTIRVDNINTNAATTIKRAHHGAQCTCGAALAANDATQILRMHANLKGLTAASVTDSNVYIIWSIYDAPNQVIESVSQH